MKRGRISRTAHQKERNPVLCSRTRHFQQQSRKNHLCFGLCGVLFLICSISQFRALGVSNNSRIPPADTYRRVPENETVEGLMTSHGTTTPTISDTLTPPRQEVQPENKKLAEGPIPNSINTQSRSTVSHEETKPGSTNRISSTPSHDTLPQEPPQQQQQSIVKNAIVHIGPYKTGSSTIQEYSDALRKELLKDGYEMPYSHQFANGTQLTEPWSNQVQFATCFYHNANPARIAERNVYPCRKDLLESGLDIGQHTNNSIFLSAESFSSLEEEGIAALRDYLYPTWNNITIIAYYRRYYDWILSFHNEVSRTIMTEDPWSIFENNSTDLLGASIVNDLTSNIYLLEGMRHKYILNLIPRYKKYFSNIVVVNMHDVRSIGLPLHFYCVLMPHVENTCAALRYMLRSGDQLEANKSSQNIVYLQLAYAAHRKGIFHIQTEEHCSNVVVAIKSYQEKVLNRTVADFPRRCLPSEVLDRIWNTSVQAEKEFGNNAAVSANGDGYHHDDGGGPPLAAHRDDFEKLSKSRLCDVDFDAILETLAWREFFEKHLPMLDMLTNKILIRNKDLVGNASTHRLIPE